jgi:8-oxo-dGTP diphosphatase
MSIIQVLAAVIIKDNKILCTQRGEHKYDYLANKWEFPGGKMETGESQEETIRREIREELSMEIEPIKRVMSHIHHYADFSIELHAWICLQQSENFELIEHQSSIWLTASELKKLDWAEADVEVVNFLMETPGLLLKNDLI